MSATDQSVTLTQYLAIYAAALSSIVFAWDIVKWRRGGARLQLRISGDMLLVGPGQPGEQRSFVSVDVANVGAKPTTITHLFGRVYKSRWRRWLRRKPATQFVVGNPDPGQIPALLEPGRRWTGLVEQNERLEAWARDQVLYIGIYHALGKRPVMRRLKLDPKT